MRTSLLAGTLVLAMLLATGPIGTMSAQETTTPDQATVELLAETMTTAELDLTQSPAELWLIRFTYAPGAASLVGDVNGHWVAYVESGALTIEGDELTQATGGERSTPNASSKVLTAGDAVSAPTGSVVSARNEGDEPATILLFLTFPTTVERTDETHELVVTPDPDTPEPTADFMALGSAEDFPDGPLTLRIERITLPTGTVVPTGGHGGPEVGYVDAGSSQLTLIDGAGFVFAGGLAGAGAAGGSPELELGEPVEVPDGGIYALDVASSAAISQLGDEETIILRATITAASGAMATPAA